MREKQRIGDNRGLVWSYYRLAHIYKSVGDFETALDYFHRSYHQAQSQSITWHISRSMGNIFLDLKNYDSSIYYFHEHLLKVADDAVILAGLGRLYLLQRNYNLALEYLQKALFNFKKRNSTNGVANTLVDIGKCYTGLKQYTRALQYVRQSMAISKQINETDALQSVYETQWNIYEALQQNDSAYFYFQHFVTLRDSLEDARFKIQFLQKLALYKVEAKEEQQQARIDLLHKDNLLKQQQLQKEAFLKKILIACLIVLALLAVIILRNIVLKRRNEKLRLESALKEQQLFSERKQAELQKQTSELEMQALRAQMNPHFIFNCLNSINRFILKSETETASDYLTKFSRLIRMVLNNSKHKYITLNEELDCLELYIQMEQLRFKHSFLYKIKCVDGIDMEETLVPPLLIQPFVENAIWHGLMHKEDGDGDIGIHLQVKDDILECVITDNGVGRKAALEQGDKPAATYKSMGLQITKERIGLLNTEQREHSIEIQDLYDSNGNAKGTNVTLRIRYQIAAEKIF